MRILIITQYFWPESFRINDLTQEWVKRGYEVTVLTGMPNYPAGKVFDGYTWPKSREQNYEGARVVRVPLFARREGRSWQLVLNYLSFVFFSCLLGPFLCRDKYDVVFIFEPSPFTVGLPGTLFRRLKKAPMFFWVQDLWPESLTAAGSINAPWLLKGAAAMVRFIYRRCDRILIQSRAFHDPAAAVGAAPERMHYFPNWAESLYQPDQALPENINAELLPEGFKVMFAGNLGEAQSLETIVDAAAALKDRYPDVHWVFLGDGRREQWVKDKVVELGLGGCVHLLGRHPVSAMPGFFAQADAMAVTLKSEDIFAYTIPSKVQSYLACGRPIVGALDGEGARIIEESGAGFAVEAEDSAGLAAAVERLYKLAEKDRVAMGQKALDYYTAHFERNRLIDELDKMMSEAVKEGLCGS